VAQSSAAHVGPSIVEPPSAIVSGRGDSGVVGPPPRQSFVAEDPEFQSLKALVLSVAESVRVLVDRDRPVSSPVPVTDVGVEVAALRNSPPASAFFPGGFCYELH